MVPEWQTDHVFFSDLLPARHPEDEIGHADGVLRCLNEKTVVVNDYSAVNPGYGRQVRDVLARNGLHIEELPYFVEDYQRDGISSAVGNYVNYLRTKDLLIVPVYGRREDGKAIERLTELLPETPIASVLCLDLAREGGVLNCIAWTARLD